MIHRRIPIIIPFSLADIVVPCHTTRRPVSRGRRRDDGNRSGKQARQRSKPATVKPVNEHLRKSVISTRHRNKTKAPRRARSSVHLRAAAQLRTQLILGTRVRICQCAYSFELGLSMAQQREGRHFGFSICASLTIHFGPVGVCMCSSSSIHLRAAALHLSQSARRRPCF